MPKKSIKKAIALCVAILLSLALLFQIPAVTKSRLQSMLNDAGFNHVEIGSTSIHPLGFSAHDIKLDEFGLDEIKNIEARLNWLSFFFTNRLSELKIDGAQISRDSDSVSSSGRQLMKNLLQLPGYRIRLSNIKLDMATIFGDIRVNVEATVNEKIHENSEIRDIKARITATQYQLGFDSTWEGTLDKGGNLDIAGTIVDGRINVGPLRISRFNGWAGLSNDKNGMALQSQLEAGSATFTGIPLQNISVVNDLTAAHNNTIIRSGVSGMPDVFFSADLVRNDKEQTFTSLLKGKNFGNFLDYVKKITKSPKPINSTLASIRDFQFICNFEPEKRFVGGPLPFSIRFMNDDEKILDGNVLFYPDTFDMRGSLETNADTATGLQQFFKIPSENIKQNFIRLDGNATKFFRFEKEIKNGTE